MYTPTAADIAAREAARAAGRATADEAHAATPADASPVPGPVVSPTVEILTADPEPDAAAIASAAAQAAYKATVNTILPDGERIRQLAYGNGATVFGVQTGGWVIPDSTAARVDWHRDGVAFSAWFDDATRARVFQLEVSEITGAAGLDLLNGPAAPESAPPEAVDAQFGAAVSETEETAPRAGNEAFQQYGGETPVAQLAQAFGADRAGDRFRAPDRGEAVRAVWTPKYATVAHFADFTTYSEADTFAYMLLNEKLAQGGVTLSGSGPVPEPRFHVGPMEVKLDAAGLMVPCLAAFAGELHTSATRWRRWAVAGWLVAVIVSAVFAAAVVAGHVQVTL